VKTDNRKSYPTPWQRELILACSKCQKKLKGDPNLFGLAKLKEAIKRHNKAHPNRALHLINVPCMDLCPKDGVTILIPASHPIQLSILRSEEDIERLLGGP
jgi:hypothetical protein